MPVLSHKANPDIYRKEFQWKEGDLTVTRTRQWSAPGCHNGCHVLFYTDKDDKLVKVEGDPNAPYNKGRLCMRCLALLEAVNHPDRIKYPMRRAGKRGENKWERISWDEAFEQICGKVKQIEAEGSTNQITVCSCTGRNAFHLVPALGWAAFGTTHHSAWFPGDSCYLPRMTAMAMIAGGPLVADCAQLYEESFDHPEWMAPDYMVIWGNNPVKSNADGFFGHWVVDLMKQGTKLITIDPEATWVAAQSEIFIQLRPGTDGAIAMAMLNVIINEKLYDEEFCDKWVYGLEQLAEAVSEMTCERAGEIAGVDPELICAAARAFANSKVASVQWGLAIDTHTHGGATALAIMDLSVICGFIDVPGGNIFPSGGYICIDVQRAFYGISIEGVQDRSEANWKNFPGYGEYPLRTNDLGSGSDGALEELETHGINAPRMIYFSNNNPIACTGAEPQRLYDDFKDIEFIVVADCFMTPTAIALADIVLPIAMSPERDSIRDWWAPYSTISKVTSFYEAKGDEEIIWEFGQRLHPDAFPWGNVKEMLDWLMGQRSGGIKTHTFNELEQKCYEYDPFEYRKYEKGLLRPDGQPGFMTNTGRLEVFSTVYAHLGLSPVPYYAEPVQSPARTPELMEEFPFVLTTGKRSFEFFHSEHRQIKTMRAFHPDPLAFINDEDAKMLGIKDGDWVWVENITGKFKQRAAITPAMKKGVVSSEHGWWFPERNPEDGSFFGTFESNPNNCTQQGDVGPSGYGTSYKTQICKVYKVTPDNDTMQRTPEEIERALSKRQYARKANVLY